MRHLESLVPSHNNEISSFYYRVPRPPLTCKVFPNVQRRLFLFTLNVVTRGGACVTTWHVSGWRSLSISMEDEVSRMKSRATEPEEVTRNIILCELLSRYNKVILCFLGSHRPLSVFPSCSNSWIFFCLSFVSDQKIKATSTGFIHAQIPKSHYQSASYSNVTVVCPTWLIWNWTYALLPDS